MYDPRRLGDFLSTCACTRVKYTMHFSIHTCTHAYIHACIHIYNHTHTHTYIQPHTHACMYTTIYTHACIYTTTHTHTYTGFVCCKISVCAYIGIHMVAMKTFVILMYQVTEHIQSMHCHIDRITVGNRVWGGWEA